VYIQPFALFASPLCLARTPASLPLSEPNNNQQSNFRKTYNNHNIKTGQAVVVRKSLRAASLKDGAALTPVRGPEFAVSVKDGKVVRLLGAQVRHCVVWARGRLPFVVCFFVGGGGGKQVGARALGAHKPTIAHKTTPPPKKHDKPKQQNNATVVRPDITAGNVTIHVIDTVLLPDDVFPTLQSALDYKLVTGPAKDLINESPVMSKAAKDPNTNVTLFVASDKAYEAYAATPAGKAVLADPVKVQKVLEYHAVQVRRVWVNLGYFVRCCCF
jgi:hypothetical protein